MINYEQALNPEQLEVVRHGDGPCLVLAGAGSGKTRTITYRAAYLLEQGVEPENILLLTFTNKAAREMNQRVELLAGRQQPLPWSGTFHHIGYRILKKYAPFLGIPHGTAGYTGNFTILDSEDSLGLFKLCLKQEGIDRQERRFPSPRVLQSIVSYARNAETTIADVLDLKHPRWLGIADVLVRLAADYEQRKRVANAMDFDDLLVNTQRLLLPADGIRKKYSEQFHYVLVDEYQDTNRIQAAIIKLLAAGHKNILVVGDDAQSIYSFRAADIQNILDFTRAYPAAKVFRLETNYRSTPDILQVANVVIANNKNQYKKELRSVIESFARPEVHSFADQMEEAEFVAGRILGLCAEGAPLAEMAVLFRAAWHSQALEVELVRRNIPYEYRGGVRFFERAHIKDALAYLRIFNNPADAVAWRRVLQMQAGIGPAGAERIITAWQHLNITALSSDQRLAALGSLLSPRSQAGWNDFLQVWEALAGVEEKSASALIRAVVDSKYRDYLESEHPDYCERVQDLEQLASFAEQQSDLTGFIATASLQEGYSAGEVRDSGDSSFAAQAGKLILSTIHQAKGLEWQAVFIINLSAGSFPNERSVREDNGLEEERRLFYVAVTRAKRRLYFTYPRTGSFDSLLAGPSMFLEEINQELVEEHTPQGESVFADTADTDCEVNEIEYAPEDEPFRSKPGRSFLKGIDEL